MAHAMVGLAPTTPSRLPAAASHSPHVPRHNRPAFYYPMSPLSPDTAPATLAPDLASTPTVARPTASPHGTVCASRKRPHPGAIVTWGVAPSSDTLPPSASAAAATADAAALTAARDDHDDGTVRSHAATDALPRRCPPLADPTLSGSAPDSDDSDDLAAAAPAAAAARSLGLPWRDPKRRRTDSASAVPSAVAPVAPSIPPLKPAILLPSSVTSPPAVPAACPRPAPLTPTVRPAALKRAHGLATDSDSDDAESDADSELASESDAEPPVPRARWAPVCKRRRMATDVQPLDRAHRAGHEPRRGRCFASASSSSASPSSSPSSPTRRLGAMVSESESDRDGTDDVSAESDDVASRRGARRRAHAAWTLRDLDRLVARLGLSEHDTQPLNQTRGRGVVRIYDADGEDNDLPDAAVDDPDTAQEPAGQLVLYDATPRLRARLQAFLATLPRGPLHAAYPRRRDEGRGITDTDMIELDFELDAETADVLRRAGLPFSVWPASEAASLMPPDAVDGAGCRAMVPYRRGASGVSEPASPAASGVAASPPSALARLLRRAPLALPAPPSWQAEPSAGLTSDPAMATLEGALTAMDLDDD
ncbi:hypothetical protein CXG81DRAFT_23398 [Caulochytrium protostelioides]|uniref:Uncharacterized protein n=1 Tax=Caulochytrium protostelioides TaxID=1555241 RepID=A0A4P9XEK6_9FUNG|nr:hypothetical protein CXG81DRAFT_23398 [Caulochytrium protostelioides]|eukprot:RKP03986.1 hypothetical protein CXG81DRAFT_23398 [Caulochytrium protostelioides]